MSTIRILDDGISANGRIIGTASIMTVGPGETHVSVVDDEGHILRSWTAVIGWSSISPAEGGLVDIPGMSLFAGDLFTVLDRTITPDHNRRLILSVPEWVVACLKRHGIPDHYEMMEYQHD